MHTLEHDFQTNETPASWLPGHPKQWGSEVTRIQFSAPLQNIALSDDDSLLAVCVEADIHIYTVERSGSNDDKVHLRQKRNLRSGHGGGKVSFVEF